MVNKNPKYGDINMGELSNRQNAQLAALIKHKRKQSRKMQRKSDLSYGYDIESTILSRFTERETRKLSSTFRALMIYNAFLKGRKFASAEGQLLNLGENAVENLKSNLDEYSVYIQRQKGQQRALNIVKHKLLRTDDVEEFNTWLVS
jgi:hypothetical protein